MESTTLTGPVLYLLIAWGIITAIFVILFIWRSVLTSHEDDQIFLDDSFSHERAAQAVITEKVHKIEPIVRGSIWLAGAATVMVVAYYIWDIFIQFK